MHTDGELTERQLVYRAITALTEIERRGGKGISAPSGSFILGAESRAPLFWGSPSDVIYLEAAAAAGP